MFILNDTLVSIDISNEVPEFDPNDIELEVAEAKANNEIRNFGAIYHFRITSANYKLTSRNREEIHHTTTTSNSNSNRSKHHELSNQFDSNSLYIIIDKEPTPESIQQELEEVQPTISTLKTQSNQGIGIISKEGQNNHSKDSSSDYLCVFIDEEPTSQSIQKELEEAPSNVTANDDRNDSAFRVNNTTATSTKNSSN